MALYRDREKLRDLALEILSILSAEKDKKFTIEELSEKIGLGISTISITLGILHNKEQIQKDTVKTKTPKGTRQTTYYQYKTPIIKE